MKQNTAGGGRAPDTLAGMTPRCFRRSSLPQIAPANSGRARKVCVMVVTPPTAQGYLVQSLRAAADSLARDGAERNAEVLRWYSARDPQTGTETT